MPSTNISYHLNSAEVPTTIITTHYAKNADGIDTEELHFYVFKIETAQGEANYFIISDEQLNEFIDNLRILINQRDRISKFE